MEKSRGGAALALFTVFTRDGCRSSARAIARMAAPKKGKRDRRHTMDQLRISDMYSIETEKEIQNLEQSTTSRADILTLANWAHWP